MCVSWNIDCNIKLSMAANVSCTERVYSIDNEPGQPDSMCNHS